MLQILRSWMRASDVRVQLSGKIGPPSRNMRRLRHRRLLAVSLYETRFAGQDVRKRLINVRLSAFDQL